MNYDEAVAELKQNYGLTRVEVIHTGSKPEYWIKGNFLEEDETVPSIYTGHQKEYHFFTFGAFESPEFVKEYFALVITDILNQQSEDIMPSIYALKSSKKIKYLTANMLKVMKRKSMIFEIERWAEEKHTNQAGTNLELIIYFKGVKRGLKASSMTVKEALVEATGTDDVDKWPGLFIELEIVKNPASRGPSSVLRVKPTAPHKPAAKRTAKKQPDPPKVDNAPQKESEPMPLFDDIASAGAYSS